MILCLETSSDVCSVALCDGNGVILTRESNAVKSHAALLTVFIDDILKKNKITAADLEAVAVTGGPGSYTGLRIGVSTAKGIAYSANLPLISITSLLSMFYGFVSLYDHTFEFDDNDLFCPLIDARRMEVYSACYDRHSQRIQDVKAEIIDTDTFGRLPECNRIFIFGSGAEKCKNVVKRKNCIFVDDFSVSASYMYKPVYERYTKKEFEDVAYFEPFYLKDFMATKQVKNILRK